MRRKKRLEENEKRSLDLTKLHEKAMESQNCLERTMENFQNKIGEMISRAVKDAVENVMGKIIEAQSAKILMDHDMIPPPAKRKSTRCARKDESLTEAPMELHHTDVEDEDETTSDTNHAKYSC